MLDPFSLALILTAAARTLPKLVEAINTERKHLDARNVADDPAERLRTIHPRPMMPTRVAQLPGGPEWTYELKWRGTRAVCVKAGRHVWMYSSDGVIKPPSPIENALAQLPEPVAVFDGQVVRAAQMPGTFVYCVFDILQLNRTVLLDRALSERRHYLRALQLVRPVIAAQPLVGNASDFVALQRHLDCDGLVAKRNDSRYEPGTRSDAWRTSTLLDAASRKQTSKATVHV